MRVARRADGTLINRKFVFSYIFGSDVRYSFRWISEYKTCSVVFFILIERQSNIKTVINGNIKLS